MNFAVPNSTSEKKSGFFEIACKVHRWVVVVTAMISGRLLNCPCRHRHDAVERLCENEHIVFSCKATFGY